MSNIKNFRGHTHMVIIDSRGPQRFWEVILYTEKEVALLPETKRKHVETVTGHKLLLEQLFGKE